MRTPELLSDPVFHDEEAARLYLQEARWPDGVYCPFCGTLDGIKPLGGDSMGPGWFYCETCQDKFTVRVGSVMERSHIPLHKWLLAFRLMASSKKGVSAHQLHRSLGITYKSAWFLGHRIREAMTDNDPSPLGGKDKHIEVDETYLGPPAVGLHAKDNWHFVNGKGWVQRVVDKKQKVLTIVERGGRARSVRMDRLTSAEVYAVLRQNTDPESHLNTDEAPMYKRPGRYFASHEAVEHYAEEWVRGEAHTNTVEGYFSIFKRGMKGIYQHCSEQHLNRYLAEFDFRYSNRIALGIDDTKRTEIAIKGAAGKRLTYRNPRSAA